MSAPAQVGPYAVVATLGKGGMGTVFEVSHPQQRERLALKLLDGELLTPQHLERFRREARILELLGHHPGIARLRDVGEDRGRPFLVMDLYRGGTLESRLAAGEVTGERAQRDLVQVARAVHFAHEAGIIHRDLKPANILYDALGSPRVADFGVARDESGGASSLTKSGAFVGTLDYMAPEQVESSRKVDRRADVYSLGAILYRLHAGGPPFAGAQGPSALKRILLEKPPPLAAPAAVARLAREALEKDPAKRPASAEDFARRLEEALGGGGKAKAPGRGRLAVLALGGAAAVVSAFALGTLVPRGAAPAVPPPVVAPSSELASLWASARATLASGDAPADEVVARLEALAKAGDAAPAPEVRAALPGLAARAAIRAGRPLEPGAWKGEALQLLEVERLARAGDGGSLGEAVKLAAEVAGFAPPWHPEHAVVRLDALARLCVARGQRGAAARALMAAAREATAKDERRARIEQAYALDLNEAASSRFAQEAASVLAAAASEDLVETQKDPDAITRGRRRLIAARLLAPSLELGPQFERLVALSQATQPVSVREAARPWRKSAVRTISEFDAFRIKGIGRSVDGLRGEEAIPPQWRPAFSDVHGEAVWIARGLLEDLVVASPDQPVAWLNLGRIYVKASMSDEGLRALTYGDGLVDGDSEFPFYLGGLHDALGHTDRAFAAYEVSIARERAREERTKKGQGPWSRVGASRILVERGDLEQARVLLRQVVNDGELVRHVPYWELVARAFPAGSPERQRAEQVLRPKPR